MMLEVLEHLEEPEAMLDDLAELTTRHVLLERSTANHGSGA